MILHTLDTGPGGAAFRDCLRIAGSDDVILLTGAGVYAALDNTSACEQLLESGAEIFVLEADTRAAGILERINNKIAMTDFDGFVSLTERFPRQLAWY